MAGDTQGMAGDSRGTPGDTGGVLSLGGGEGAADKGADTCAGVSGFPLLGGKRFGKISNNQNKWVFSLWLVDS